MRHLARVLSPVLLLAVIFPGLALAQGQASLLEPISDTDVKATNSFIAATANDQGQVMAVFYGTRGRAHADRHLVSLLGAGGSWQQTDLPLPADRENYYGANNFYGMTWHGNKFALLFRMSGRYYHVTWSGGAWAVPQQLPRGEDAGSINFDADGNLIFYHRGDREFRRLVGNDLQTVKLPSKLDNPGASDSIYRGRNGALHIMGVGARYIPVVASVPVGADPMQAENWVYQPPPGDGYTTAIGALSHEKRIVLDWPRQTVWASWEADDNLYVSHAPIGASSEAAWQTGEIEPPEGGKIIAHRLASSGGGSMAVTYMELPPKPGSSGAGRYRKLYFRWLLPNGLGEELALLRPGTQTEAAQFSELSNSSMNLVIGPDGVAHFFIKGKKRGEWPANAERVYYSQITGGAVLATEPGVAGGGQTVATGEGQEPGETQPPETGGKPDLVASVEFRYEKEYILRDGERIRRYTRSHSIVRPEVTITNNGAEYFGDLWADILVDGATIHYHVADETNHMRPMLERGASKTLHKIPGFKYEFKPQEGWEPPVLQVEHSRSAPNVHMYTGLGRKQLKIIADPDNKIAEENEDNNVTELEYEVCDGREDADRIDLTTVEGKRQRSGYNDLAILGSPRILANSAISVAGLVQRPAEVKLIVGNPRQASFFKDVTVVALLDGDEIWRTVLPLVDDVRRLENAQTEWLGYTAPKLRKGPDVCGGFLDVPVDLTRVAVGAHTLTLILDADDIFADLDRANNTATIQFNVREPGGTLHVAVTDKGTGEGIALARMFLWGLYAGRCNSAGTIDIADVPAGHYEPEQLLAWRLVPAPTYSRQSSQQGFTMTNGGAASVTVVLEQPVDVIVHVLDAGTGEVVPERAWARLKHLEQRIGDPTNPGFAASRRRGNTLYFYHIPPGQCEIRAGAYAWNEGVTTQQVHRDAEGECQVEIQVTPRPRGSITGVVTEHNGRAVSGVEVWLDGAPRRATSDRDGHFEMTEVEAGRQYRVLARKRSYIGADATSGTVAADTACTVNLTMAKIVQKHESAFVDAITWAMVEQWPGFNLGGGVSSDKVEVSAEFGKFKAGLGMLYHQVQGTDEIIVDDVTIGTIGGVFWEEHVTTEYSLKSLASSVLTKVGGKHAAKLLKVISPINFIYGQIVGEVDYHELGDDGQVTGTFTTHTGAEYKKPVLIAIPSAAFSPGMSGGQTVVRCDRVEVTDGGHSTVVNYQWYSPKVGTYHVGEAMDLDKLEVTFYLAVLNEDLSPGLLGNTSSNVIIWHPKSGSVRFEWRAYDPLDYLR